LFHTIKFYDYTILQFEIIFSNENKTGYKIQDLQTVYYTIILYIYIYGVTTINYPQSIQNIFYHVFWCIHVS